MKKINSTNIWFAIGLTTFAGLSTGLGGLIVLLFKKTNTKLLSVSLGFSAGVMIYVSFVELFSDSRRLLVSTMGEEAGARFIQYISSLQATISSAPLGRHQRQALTFLYLLPEVHINWANAHI